MPRPIDYNGRAEANEVRRKLYQTSAIINAVKDKNMSKAEFLSGKELAPKDSPVQTLLKEEEIVRATKPIVDAIKSIPRLDTLQDDVVESGDIDKNLKRELLQSLGLTMPSTMLQEEYDYDYLTNTFEEARQLRNNASRRIGAIKRSAEYKAASSENKQAMLRELAADRDGIEDYMSRVKGMIDNREVFGKGILTTLEDVLNRFKLLVGEIQAGNTNKELKNEVSEIGHYLYANGYLPKKLYGNLMHNIKE